MNLKEMKDSEQIQVEIEFWEGVVKNGGGKGTFISESPLCRAHDADDVVFDQICISCPLKIFTGDNCDKGTPYPEWEENRTPETAQAMVDRLKEIKHRLFRLDR